MAADEFVPVRELAESARLTVRLLIRRANNRAIGLWRDPRDERRILVRTADANRLLEPRPVGSPDEADPSAADAAGE